MYQLMKKFREGNFKRTTIYKRMKYKSYNNFGRSEILHKTCFKRELQCKNCEKLKVQYIP